VVKACKTLVKLYIENNQFYETEAVLAMAEKGGVDMKYYKELSEACMFVIKQKYKEAVPVLKRLDETISGMEGAVDREQLKEAGSKLKSNRNSKPEEPSYDPKNISYSKRSNHTSKPAKISFKVEVETPVGHSHPGNLKRNKTIELEAAEEVANISKPFHSNRKYHAPRSSNFKLEEEHREG
jgi:hypothetical protein